MLKKKKFKLNLKKYVGGRGGRKTFFYCSIFWLWEKFLTRLDVVFLNGKGTKLFIAIWKVYRLGEKQKYYKKIFNLFFTQSLVFKMPTLKETQLRNNKYFIMMFILKSFCKV